MTNSQWIQESESVFRARTDEKVLVSESLFEFLCTRALQSNLKRARLCLHADDLAPVQNMIIALHRDTDIPIHKHSEKSETISILRGETEIVFFDDNGLEIERRDMAPGDLVHIPAACYHTLRVKSDFVVIHEVSKGPFEKSTVFKAAQPLVQ